MNEMKVLIVGSLPKKATPERDEKYRNACRDIGKKLADSGWPIGIGTFTADTADALIVEGAAKSDRPANVTVYFRDEEAGPFEAEIERRKSQDHNLVFELKNVEGTWVAGRIEQMQNSDIVLMIGGADKTAPAFIVAHLLRIPCLPVPGLGGASDVQWPKFRLRIQSPSLDPEKELRRWVSPWNADKSATAVLGFMQRYVNSNPYPEKGRFLPLLLTLAVCSAAIWEILFFRQSPAKGWTLFGIIVATSVMGAALHWIILLLSQNAIQASAGSFFARVVAAIIEAIALFLLLVIGAGFIMNGSVSTFYNFSNEATFGRLTTIVAVFGFASGLMTHAVNKSLMVRVVNLVSTHNDGSADHKP